MKKLLLIFLILLFPLIANAAVWFDCTWEDGSDAQNTGGTHVWDAASNTPQRVTPSELMEGSYALQTDDDDKDSVYDGNGSTWGKTTVYVRWAFRWISESIADTGFCIFGVFRNDAGNPENVTTRLYDDAGTIKVDIMRNDGSWAAVGTMQTVTQNTWYQIEIYWKSDTGGGGDDGEVGWRLFNKAGTVLYDDYWSGGASGPATHGNELDIDYIELGNSYSTSRDDATIQYDVFKAADEAIGAYTAPAGGAQVIIIN